MNRILGPAEECDDPGGPARRSPQVHRWNRNPRPQPQTFIKLVLLI